MIRGLLNIPRGLSIFWMERWWKIDLFEAIKVALSSLRTNKLRSALTTLGIIIGVMTVIGMISLIQGMNNTVASQLGKIGVNTLYVEKHPWMMNQEDWLEMRKRKDLTLEDAEAIREFCSAVSAVAPELYTGAPVKFGNEATKNTWIGGTTFEDEEISNFDLEKGRFLTPSDLDHRRSVCVLGATVVEKIFHNLEPVGREVNIRQNRFLVIGVLEKQGSTFGSDQDNVVIIPITTFIKYYGGEDRSVTIKVLPKSPEAVDLAIDQITELLRRRRGVPPNKPDDFAINTQGKLLEVYRKITAAIYVVMIGVASLSLLVGGIGIMNIMLVSVTERTREIGIRKALGARRRDIRWQFLIEAVTLSSVGGLIGIVLGFSIAKLISLPTHLPSAVSPWSILLGFGFSSLVGIFFGLYPATKAARLDQIEALRYE